MKVPFVDLRPQFLLLRQEILARWEDILDRASFIGGEYVEEFEKKFAQATEVKHAIAVASGTDALLYTLRALGVEKGDEIILPVNTFIATAEAVSHCGARPVFVDIDSRSWTIDPQLVEQAITNRTKGVIAVHLYGQPANMDLLNELAGSRGLFVIEDACQAHLARYHGKPVGSLAKAAAFSFYPGKNLGGCGESGAVTTNDDYLAAEIRMLRDHGQREKYIHKSIGYNGRCDALQAAALSVKLDYLEKWNKQRRKCAELYSQKLGALKIVTQAGIDQTQSVYHLYVVLLEQRELIRGELFKRGVETALHYPVPLHEQQAYSFLGYQKGDFPVAEHCATRLLSLPMFPGLTEEQVVYIADCLEEIIDNGSK